MRRKCRLLLFEVPALEAQPRHKVAVSVGRNLSLGCDIVGRSFRFRGVHYVKIPWDKRLSQYLEGQWDYPSQIRILLHFTQFCIRRQVRYPSYGPWHRTRAARMPRQVLPQGAKTRVRVFADIQNFALCAHCVCTACMAFPLAPALDTASKCRYPVAQTKMSWRSLLTSQYSR